jgi:hypothetical protein
MAVIAFWPGFKHRLGSLKPAEVSDEAVGVINDFRFLIPFVGCWCLAFLAYLYAEFATNPSGIPLLTLIRNPLEAYSNAHRWGKDGGLTIITASLWVWTPLLYLGARLHRYRSVRLFLLALALLYPFMAVMKLSRSDMFVAVFTIAIVHLATASRQPPHTRKYVLFALPFLAAAGVLMIGLAVLRSGAGTTSTYSDFIEFKMKSRDPGTLAFGQIYGYFALPFENLHRQMESVPGGQGFGSSLVRPALSLLGQGDYASEQEEKGDLRIVNRAAGSATFLSLIYGDTGYLGVLVVPLLYAGLVTWVYWGWRRTGSLLRLGLWLNFVYPWAWIYFNNGFARLNIYTTPLYLLGVYAVYLVWKRNSENTEIRGLALNDSTAL